MVKCLVVVVGMVFGIGTGAQPASSPPDASRMLTQPYAQFGFEVLRELHSQHPKENLFISPTSIAVALAMTSNGASGSTREAILRPLHFDGQSIEIFNAANHALILDIANTEAVQLSQANALWAQQGIPINPSFNHTLESVYAARGGDLDFRSAAAVQAINTWVAKHTNNRIQKIVDQIDPSTVVMLTDAIAFKGKWTLPFDPKATQSHDFKTANGIVRQVPMMKHSAKYAYASANGLEAIRLPYADGAFAMYVVLPQTMGRMQSFLEHLTPDSFSRLISSLQMRRGTIELPRFTMTYDTTLNGILKKLGIEIAFSGNANFENIHKGPQRMQISEVRHASFLKVDEAGTEAAVATSIGMRALAMPMREPSPFHMVVDRPFFLAIRDERNGQLLFTGTIFDPKD